MSVTVRSKKNLNNVSARLLSRVAWAVLAAVALMGAVCNDNSTGPNGGGNGEPSPVTLANLETPEIMIEVEGGNFNRGCRNDEESEPVCRKQDGTDENTCIVTCLTPAPDASVKTFYICKFEVTQGLWKEVMGAYNNPSEYKGDNLPVTNVTGMQISTFISELNTKKDGGGYTYRLPSESEWEYAARGGVHGSENNYTYSGSDNAGEVARYGSASGPRPVDDANLRSNELGIHGMSGNVWEVAFAEGNTSGNSRVERGGSWFGKEDYCRVTYRNDLVNNNRVAGLSDRGFRIAATRE